MSNLDFFKRNKGLAVGIAMMLSAFVAEGVGIYYSCKTDTDEIEQHRKKHQDLSDGFVLGGAVLFTVGTFYSACCIVSSARIPKKKPRIA